MAVEIKRYFIMAPPSFRMPVFCILAMDFRSQQPPSLVPDVVACDVKPDDAAPTRLLHGLGFC
jgi:hypothetical protein